MKSYFGILFLLGVFAIPATAQQVSLVGKIRDSSGVPIAGVTVSLAANHAIVATTDNKGVFNLQGQITGIVFSKPATYKPLTQCSGNTIYLSVNEPTAVEISVYNTLGKRLAIPLNKLVNAGEYRIPITTALAHQMLLVRVKRGNDVKAYRMQSVNIRRNAAAVDAKVSSLGKTNAMAAVDTLVFSRRGVLTQRMPIALYAQTDTIFVTMQPISEPYLICKSLNLTPADTDSYVHVRNDSAYNLSVVAQNIGGGNAYSSEVYIKSADTTVLVDYNKSTLSNVTAGLMKTGTPITLRLKRSLTPGKKVRLLFHFVDSWSGSTRNWYDTLDWAPRPFRYEGAVLDDDNISPSAGNGNGKVEPGERIGVAPVIKNLSDLSVTTVTGRILSTYAGIDTVSKNSFFLWMGGTLGAGKDGTLDSEFVSTIAPSMNFIYGANPLFKDSIRYDVLISGTYAGGKCSWIQPVYCAARVTDTARMMNITPINCSVSKSPNKAYYLTGDTVRLVATPSTGYHFVGWSGDTVASVASVKFTMNKSKTVTATCLLDSFALTMRATNGTVIINPDKQKYAYGDLVTLTAVPNTACYFLNWGGVASGNNNPIQIALTKDTAYANFAPPYTVTITATNGTVSKNPDKTLYTYGDTVTLTAVPAADCRFVNWSGGWVSGSSVSTKIVLKANVYVTANFTSPCTLTVNATNGTVTKNPDKPQYAIGDTITLTAVAATDCRFLNWSGTVTGSANPTKIVLNTKAVVNANFAPPCTLTTNAPNGTVMKSPDKQQYALGDTVTLTANPAIDCRFLSWNGAVTGIGNPTKLVFAANAVVTAIFLPPCTLTVNATNGTILKNPDKLQYGIGDTVTLTAIPNVNCRFVQWSGAINGKSNPIKIAMSANLSVTANIRTAIIAIETGEFHSMFLSNDGFLWATGNNNKGQLGDGTTATKYTPIQIMAGVTAVSAGYEHTMILKSDGSLWATGSNDYGQLGDGTNTTKNTPFQIMTSVAAVSAGVRHTMILKSDGSLWATGDNSAGQLGDGTTTSRHTPIQIMTSISAVSAGYGHTMILKSDGSLWANGDNFLMAGVSAVSAGYGHTMILKSDGSLWATGDNSSRQLGDGTTTSRHTPIQIMAGVSAVSAGARHTMILKSDGSLWANGSNDDGQLGDGTDVAKSTPVQIMEGVSAVSAGDRHTMILKSDGTLWGTGSNDLGQLGGGTNQPSYTPIQVQ